jgi:hypothetical protein
MARGKKGTSRKNEVGICSVCAREKKLATLEVPRCHTCYQKFRLERMTDGKRQEYEDNHRTSCLKYYWENRDRERERQRAYYDRVSKGRVRGNRKKVQRTSDVEHPSVGPCLLCGGRYSNHDLCDIVLTARRNLSD